MFCVRIFSPFSTFVKLSSMLDSRFSVSWIASMYLVMFSSSAITSSLILLVESPFACWVSSLAFACWTRVIAVFRNTLVGLLLVLRALVGDWVWPWVWAVERGACSVALLLLLGFFGAAWVSAFGMTWLVTGVLLSLSGVLKMINLVYSRMIGA